MKDDFLHRIDVNRLKSELKMDVSEIARLSGISENGVYKWSWSKENNGTRPNYNAIIRLLLAGASTMTLFGVKTDETIVGHSKLTNEDLSRAFRIAADILEQKDK